jgi:hypothetical protein
MRTTLTLDDDILKIAARQAKLRGVSFSKTVSGLLRRGLSSPTPSQTKGGIVIFKITRRFAPRDNRGGAPNRSRGRMKGYLLDTNMLIALFWPSHRKQSLWDCLPQRTNMSALQSPGVPLGHRRGGGTPPELAAGTAALHYLPRAVKLL